MINKNKTRREILGPLQKRIATLKEQEEILTFDKWTNVVIPPDSDLTVLICNRHWDDPVWLGYLSGEGWRFVEGELCVPQPEAWMDLPDPAGA